MPRDLQAGSGGGGVHAGQGRAICAHWPPRRRQNLLFPRLHRSHWSTEAALVGRVEQAVETGEAPPPPLLSQLLLDPQAPCLSCLASGGALLLLPHRREG